MAPLSFSVKTPSTIEPDRVILDTTDLIKTLRKRLDALGKSTTDAPPKVREDLIKELHDREDRLYEMMIEALQYTKRIELELIVTCMDVLRNEFGITEDEESQEIAQPLFDFGMQLLERLEQIRAYQRGYLKYHFSQLLGTDIVVMRILPPPLNY